MRGVAVPFWYPRPCGPSSSSASSPAGAFEFPAAKTACKWCRINKVVAGRVPGTWRAAREPRRQAAGQVLRGAGLACLPGSAWLCGLGGAESAMAQPCVGWQGVVGEGAPSSTMPRTVPGPTTPLPRPRPATCVQVPFRGRIHEERHYRVLGLNAFTPNQVPPKTAKKGVDDF